MPITKTPDEWLAMPKNIGIVVLDPDGWDIRNFEEDWEKPISEKEFEGKLCASTCYFPKKFFKPA